MKVAVSGARGFLGKEVCKLLDTEGHIVVPLVRRHDQAGVYWNPDRDEIDSHGIEGLDAVIHLAGENIAARRWSTEQKLRILESRVRGTKLISRTISKLSRPPRVFISASAAGYYGPSVWNEVDESAPPGVGFLADVCKSWESAAKQAFLPKTHIVIARLGMVLGQGGAMAKMLPIFRLGLGARLGSGKQWISWISLRDAARAILLCLDSPAIIGELNFVSPSPCTNAEFTKALGKSLKRPTFGVVPPFALKLLYGEMAVETALASSRVIPKRLLEYGFQFRDSNLSETLNHILRNSDSDRGV